MLEDQKTTTACSAFEQHRFKGHLCVHCFKDKSAHLEKAEEKMATRKILALDNNINKVQEHDGKAAKQKYDIPKVIIRNQNNLHKDVKGRGDRQTERNNRKRGKERIKEPLPHNAKREATSKPTQNVVTLNIPLEAEHSSGLDNEVSSRNQLKQSVVLKSSESSSENGSIHKNLISDKQGQEINGNSEESELELSGSYGEQLRRALRPVQKAGSPPRTRDRNRRDPELPEFVKVAKNLRHIQSMGIISSAEIHSSNNNNHSVIETEEMLPNLPDLPNVVGSDASAEEQQKLVDSKSMLPVNIVMNTQGALTGHETLPKNIGKSRPSIKPLTKHKRQISDPEVFNPSTNEEIVVNVSDVMSEKMNDVKTENMLVRNSQLSSDVYFGKSPVTSPQKRALADEQEDLAPRYGHIADCVTIISQSGEVSHHYERDREIESDASPRSPTENSNPYRVVELHENQSKTSTKKSLDSEGASSSSRGRASHEMDEGVGLNQQEDVISTANPSSCFPRRSVALVDGIYTASQFTDSGINDSMESSDSSDGPKQSESPPVQSSKRNTPPYPIILHDEPQTDHRKKKRNSGQYKVPIFIMPKAHDSKAWSVTKEKTEGDVDTLQPKCPDQGIDYLQPKEKSREKQVAGPSQEKVIKNENVQNLLDSKKVSSSDEALIESRRPSRSRSKTHPVLEETKTKNHPALEGALSNGAGVKDQDIPDFSRTRLKRVAPRPPSMEFTDQNFGRERDDRLDSLPHRSPPPIPQSKKETKKSIERSSSDLSDDIDKSSHPQSPYDKVMVESSISANAARSDGVWRELSPVRHRDMSPLRNQRESRKVTPVKKEGNFRARLREFSPTGRRELSPMSRVKQMNKDNQTSIPPMRRMASPPPPLNRPQPLNLPNTTSTQDAPAVTTKSKRSKLPWKRKKKRNDSGSPEREFNSEEVEKWLVSSFSASPPSAIPPVVSDPNPRNSLERLEVINAYKGEPTVAIKRASEAATSAASPGVMTTTNVPSTHTPILSTPVTSPTNNNRNSLVESEDDDISRSAGKRRAPKPPTPLPDHQDGDISDDPIPLQKSYSLSPTSRRKNDNGERAKHEEGEESHLYENLGANRAKIAPQKPARRRHRNRTTGFEDLPSRIKRMAPKTPEKVTTEEPSDDVIEGSSAKKLVFDDIPLSSSPPLKSALRSTVSEPPKVDADGKVVPKRPVRIIAPDDEAINTQVPPSTILRSDYTNLALVPQVNLDDTIHKDAETQVETAEQRKEKTLVDADAQCSLNSVAKSSIDQASQRFLLNDVSTVHLQALTQLARTIPRSPLDWTDCKDSVWKEQISGEPSCRSAGAAFYSITHSSHPSAQPGIMVCCDPSKTTQVLQMAEMTKSSLTQPNLISVSHAMRDTITIDPTLIEQRKSRNVLQSGGPIETALVITDNLPTGNVADFVMYNVEKHEYLAEVYERDVALMVLQLCQGLCQLQSHHMCLESLKLDHLLLTESGLPGGGHRLVINHLMGAEVISPTTSDEKEVASKLEQKCHEFDVGILIYEYLHQPNPFSTRTSLIISDYTADDLPNIPIKSSFTVGLRTIAAKLLAKNPLDRLTCNQAIALLQCLVWGPSSTIYIDNGSTDEALNQELEKWLVAEQAKMVSKVALYSVLGQAGLTLTDQLQCQYLADLTIDTCKEALKMLYGDTHNEMVYVIDSDLDL